MKGVIAMTMNPNTRVSDLHPARKAPDAKRPGSLTIGSIFAAAFIAVVSFITRRLYR